MKKKFRDYLAAITTVLIIGISIAGTSSAQTNTTLGTGAGQMISGTDDTALGYHALFDTINGSTNSAVGSGALPADFDGIDSTATGASTITAENGNGTNRVATANGAFAMGNSACGPRFGVCPTDGVAIGYHALFSEATGDGSTAIGANALDGNEIAVSDTAIGYSALSELTRSNRYNTAVGSFSLQGDTSGQWNTALGVSALSGNKQGHINIAIGYQAGINRDIGSNNIDIANKGLAGEGNRMRIGTPGTHNATYIAGIANSGLTGTDVVIDGSGRLGVVPSSARYKKNISDMGASSESLMKLHPVTFNYKNDPQAVRQFGLIAEEVDQVYPELVVRDADRKIESVRYSMLTPMLLNELQIRSAKVSQRSREIEQRNGQISLKEQQIGELSAELTVANRELARLKRTVVTRLSALEKSASIDAHHNPETALK